MPIFIYRSARINNTKPRRIIARLQNALLPEVVVAVAALNTSKTTEDFQYEYEIIEDIPQLVSPLQVDTSKARKTNRAICFALSYKTHNNEREYLAYHAKYGTIRGTVEDSAKGARLFLSRIVSVWPNAEPER
jgi:hypothetical protein